MWSLLVLGWVVASLAVFPLLFAEGRRDRTDDGETDPTPDRAEGARQLRS